MTTERKIELRQKIDRGIKAAVAQALEEHRRAGRPIAVWRDGKVAIIPVPEPPSDLVLQEKPKP
ncbi:hypothetical protein [Pedosphaera parvula]|uniref:Uncharacterized protein n=1 Tax=Pedosphaera parvula (strain Ellin514) TaxID=320771 RepID=B9XMG1_PEDPL|nr:hypothetical protein [Pedosphaera parvula]EEF59003.1 conserved hypothetical protein [Pedosphaera parvula Ellin514]